jgi:hypothetical protein
LARIAAENVARERAAADLQLLRSLVAVAGLVHGREAGRAAFERYENELMKKANGEDNIEHPTSNIEPRTRRRGRRGTPHGEIS